MSYKCQGSYLLKGALLEERALESRDRFRPAETYAMVWFGKVLRYWGANKTED